VSVGDFGAQRHLGIDFLRRRPPLPAINKEARRLPSGAFAAAPESTPARIRRAPPHGSKSPAQPLPAAARRAFGRWPAASKSVQSLAQFDACAGSPHGGNKVARCGGDIDPLVGPQPVHLLDRGLGRKAARQGAALAGRLDRKAKRS